MNNIVNPIQIPLNPITVGKIGGAYGVQGCVKIISFTDTIDSIFNYAPWFVLFRNQWKLMYLEYWKILQKSYIVKITNILNREDAMSLAQCPLIIDESQLPLLSNNEYYWKDIIGCKVFKIQNSYLGYVIRIIETIAHDILVIKINTKNSFVNTKECLIPFIQDEIVKDVNLSKKIIVVDWYVS